MGLEYFNGTKWQTLEVPASEIYWLDELNNTWVPVSEKKLKEIKNGIICVNNELRFIEDYLSKNTEGK